VFAAWSMQNGYKEVLSSIELVIVKKWVKFWRWQSKMIEKKWQEMN
jgi:hypothetical protein